MMSQGQARSSSKIIFTSQPHRTAATDGQSDWQEGHCYWTTYH